MKEEFEEIIFSCNEHVDQAIDDYVNYLEVSPQLIKTSEDKKCTYCNKNAVYKIIK